jgi:hypothetical protein
MCKADQLVGRVAVDFCREEITSNAGAVESAYERLGIAAGIKCQKEAIVEQGHSRIGVKSFVREERIDIGRSVEQGTDPDRVFHHRPQELFEVITIDR